jgi:Ca-activated chloride channel family protein
MRFSAIPPLALLAAVAFAVVLLYLLKPSPRRLIMSSTLIWRRVLRSRNRTPDRLRWWISLLLAAAIALSIALALTQPRLDALGGAAQRVALVLDNSATLATLTADGKTRWEHAHERAREVVHSGGAGSRYLVADTQRTIASPRFEEPDAALETLGRLRVVPGGEPLFPDVFAADGTDLRAVFVTDGVAAVLPSPGAETLSVFQVADNVGITAFDVRAIPGDARRHQGFVEVLNASPGAKRVELQVAGAGRGPIARVLDIPGGAVASETFEVSVFESGPLQASVSTQYDAFAADDVAYSYLPASKAIRVGLVTAGDSFLERSLRLLPRTQLRIVPARRVSARSGVDVWVFDRYAPAQPPGVPTLLFRPPHADWLPASDGDLGATAVAAWVRGHPVTDGLSLRDVLAEHALAIRAGARTQVLATDASRRPLILASASGPRWVEVAFSLEDSNLPLQAGFPVFLSNVVDWMTGEPLALKSGPALVQLPLTGAKVLDLQGHTVATREVAGATLVEVERPGLYTATAGDRRVRLAVNVADPAVTAVNASRLAPEPAAPGLQAWHWTVNPWLALLLAAALLLVLEWWTYNRRLTV